MKTIELIIFSDQPGDFSQLSDRWLYFVTLVDMFDKMHFFVFFLVSLSNVI